MSVNNSNISKLFRTLVGLPERVDMAPTTTIPSLRPREVGYGDPEPEPEEPGGEGGGE